MLVSVLGVNKGSGDRTLVGLALGDTDVAFMGQEYLIHDGKEPVEVQVR